MGGRTSELPKCLLEVGGRPLIEHQLETLADCGVGPVAIVVGHCADEIREVVGIRAEYIDNPRWRRTNSLYSFWIARDWVDGPLMLLNSDLLYEPRIIERLLAADGDAIAIDSGSGAAAEQMKVQVERGRVVGMSKSLPETDSAGENLGILRFEAASARRLVECAGALVDAGGENCWLGAAVSELASRIPIRALDVAGHAWAEIDFAYDLDRARKHVWPVVRNARAGPAAHWRRRVRRALSRSAAIATIATLVVLTNALWVSSGSVSWEPLELIGPDPVQINSDRREERWWRLMHGESTTFTAVGPGRLRVESRMLLAGAVPTLRYAIQVEVDGVPLAWEDHPAQPSGSWRHPGATLGKRRKSTLELSEGAHEIALRVVGAGRPSALIRVSEGLSDRRRD
jgi:choline kinase